MTEQQKEFFRQVIRPVLIKLAVTDELPQDMHDLCYTPFEGTAEQFNKNNSQKVIVKIGGGCVQEVIHDIEGLKVTVIDSDIEDLNSEEETFTFEGEEYYGYIGQVADYNPSRIEAFENYVRPSERKYTILISEEGGTSSHDIYGGRLLNEDYKGDEYEFIYALQDILGTVESLKVDESEYFQPNRDNKNSKGIITRIK